MRVIRQQWVDKSQARTRRRAGRGRYSLPVPCDVSFVKELMDKKFIAAELLKIAKHIVATCMEHYCHKCGNAWFDNEPRGRCPECGSGDVVHSFDE